MSGTPCEPANLLLIRNLGMDFSTFMDPITGDGNKDRIVNEDNDKAQEPEMHKEITIHDEEAPEEMKEPTKDIIQNKKLEKN